LWGYTGSTAISLGIGDIAWIGYQSKVQSNKKS